MAAERPVAEYNSTMGVLYVCCRTIWLSHKQNQSTFQQFLNSYDGTNADAVLAMIDAAEAMPMFQERNEQTELVYGQLQLTAKFALKQWKYVRNYIRIAFDKDDRKAKWESAGSQHYEKAAGKSWSETKLMLTAGMNFIAANTTAFQAIGVPAVFAVTYGNARTAFNDAYDQFLQLEQSEKEATDAKVVANNVIYRMTMDMCEDGQLLFEDNAAKFDRFVYQRVKGLVTHPSNGDTVAATALEVIGTVTHGVTGAVMANVAVNLKVTTPTGPVLQTQQTDEFGRFKIVQGNLTADTTYDTELSVVMAGFLPTIELQPMVTGERYTEDLEMMPMILPPTP